MAEWKDHMKVILLGQVNLKVNIKQLPDYHHDSALQDYT